MSFQGCGEDFTGTSVTATYDGIAVGGYAEKDPGEAVETWRQGEFTADINLVATDTNVEARLTILSPPSWRQHGASDHRPLACRFDKHHHRQ